LVKYKNILNFKNFSHLLTKKNNDVNKQLFIDQSFLFLIYDHTDYFSKFLMNKKLSLFFKKKIKDSKG